MMKRSVDYPRLYDSTTLAALPSDELRAEYVWLLGIVGPNGSFEWSERSLWAATYAPVRDKTLTDLSRYLQAFLDAGLLVKWDAVGKTWGYFTGSEKPGRLPRESWKKRFAKNRKPEPPPPQSILDEAVALRTRYCRAINTQGACNGGEITVPELECECELEVKPLVHSANEPESGSFLPEIVQDEAGKSPIHDGKLLKANRTLMATELYCKYPRKQAKADGIKAIEKAIILVAKRDFDEDEQSAADWLAGKVGRYCKSAQGSRPEKNLIPLPATWFTGARYDDEEAEWNYVTIPGGDSWSRSSPLPSTPQRSASAEVQRQLREG
jgi:hypothetical protein